MGSRIEDFEQETTWVGVVAGRRYAYTRRPGAVVIVIDGYEVFRSAFDLKQNIKATADMYRAIGDKLLRDLEEKNSCETSL